MPKSKSGPEKFPSRFAQEEKRMKKM